VAAYDLLNYGDRVNNGYLKVNRPFTSKKREITPRFTLNTQGYYIKDDSYAITLNQTYRDREYDKYTKVILAVLNSTIAHFWLVKLGRKKGKSLELYPEVLTTIPMPNVELIKETDIIKLDDAINSGNLLDVADRFAVNWFNLDMGDINIMNKYIVDNQ
jgi:adenine-specific DNA-methyltransferase